MTIPLRLGIAGLGTVGAAVVRILGTKAQTLAAELGRGIEVRGVTARSRTKDRGCDISQARWFDDAVALASSPDIDVFVELMGGAGDPAKAAVEAALSSGKAVITANKALLAAHGQALAALAEKHGVALLYEASAAGGIPVIKTLREALSGNAVKKVSGILNGTCNYILTRMEVENLDFRHCLVEAQRLGYAEADPTGDIGGFDTANKVAILTSLAFGTEIDAEAIYIEGIASITALDIKMADELGYRIKLLGVAERTAAGIEQRVHPTMVPKTAPLAQVMGVTNAVTIDADAVGQLTLIGPGAGGDATASAVIGDIAEVAKGSAGPVFRLPAAKLEKAPRAAMQRHEGGYYVRLEVLDRKGAFATIAASMAANSISLESILQKGRLGTRGGQGLAGNGEANASVPVILITYATTETAIRAALDTIAADGVLDGSPQVIRIER